MPQLNGISTPSIEAGLSVLPLWLFPGHIRALCVIFGRPKVSLMSGLRSLERYDSDIPLPHSYLVAIDENLLIGFTI